MVVKIKDRFLGEVADYKKVYKGKVPYSFEVLKIFKLRLFQIGQAKSIADLRSIRSLHFKKLEKKHSDKYSIKLDNTYSLIFSIENIESNRLEIICIEEISNRRF